MSNVLDEPDKVQLHNAFISSPIGKKLVVKLGIDVIEFLLAGSVSISVYGIGQHTIPSVLNFNLNSRLPTNAGRYLTEARGRKRLMSIFNDILTVCGEPFVRLIRAPVIKHSGLWWIPFMEHLEKTSLSITVSGVANDVMYASSIECDWS